MKYLALVVVLCGTVVAQKYYSVKPIKNLGFCCDNYALAINNAGEVTGVVNAGIVSGEYQPQPLTWSGSTSSLGFLGRGMAINDNGDIAGSTNDGGAFLWTGYLQNLGGPGGGTAVARAINNNQQIAGVGTDSSGFSSAFFWSNSTGFISLGLSGSQAGAINASGTMVGCFPVSGSYHAFTWTNGQLTDIHSLGVFSCALGINSKGQVVGGWTDAQGRDFGFFWDPVNGMTDSIPGCENTLRAVNDLGAAVGEGCGLSAFMWTQAFGARDLNAMAGYKSLAGPTGINNAGQIVMESMQVLTPLIQVFLTATPNPAVAGQPVTLTATVTSIAGPPPDGEVVSFVMGATVLGTAPITGGNASLTVPIPKGSHGLSVIYPGDKVYKRAVAVKVTEVVN